MADDDYIDPIFDDELDLSGRPGPSASPSTPRTPSPPPAQAPSAPRQPTARPPTAEQDEPAQVTAAQLPTEEVQQRMAAVSSTPREPQPDDRVCTSCQLSNPRERNFCERCGAVLQAAAPVGTMTDEDLSWWQRLGRWFRGLRRRGLRGHARDTGRSARVAYRRGISVKNQVVRVLGLIGLVGGGMFIADLGPFAGMRDRLLDRVSSETVELRPDSITVLPADAEQTRWPASEIADGRGNTAWGSRWDEAAPTVECGAGGGAAARLRLTFPPSSVDRIELRLGLPDPNFENNGRPSRLGLVFSGSTDCQVLQLEDTHDEQGFPLDVGRAESLEIWVIDAMVDGADDPTNVVISELELFTTK